LQGHRIKLKRKKERKEKKNKTTESLLSLDIKPVAEALLVSAMLHVT